MISNDQELQVTKERIDQFQRWLVQMRRTARATEFEAVTSGYRLEIERMQAEVLEYILRPLRAAGESDLGNSLVRSSLASIPVERLDLSRRSKNALCRANLTTALEVQRLIETDGLTSINNIGSQSASEIEDCINSLVGAIGLGMLSGQSSQFIGTETEEFVIPDSYLNDLPIDVLAQELGDDLLERLKSAHVRRFGDLADISKIVLRFIHNSASSLNRLIKYQQETLQKRVDWGQFHLQAQYRGKSIETWLNSTPRSHETQMEFLDSLIRVNEFSSLTEELASLFVDSSDRDLVIFTNYHDGESTLEKVGEQIGLTRERVRQLTSRVANQLWHRWEQVPGLYFQSALLLAQDMGDQLSLLFWEQQLRQRNVIISKEIRQGVDSFDLLCSLLRSYNKAKRPRSIEVSEGLTTLLTGPSDLSLRLKNNIESIPHEAKREIKRRISYVGGVHVSEAAAILGVSLPEATDILRHLGFKEVILDWYTIASGTYTSRWPILKAGLAMMEACGPLEFDLFCDGLRRYITRFYEVLAPPAVIRKHLEILGFELEEDYVCWSETPTGYLADSDKCFIEAVTKYGPVVSFQEVLDTFQGNGFSMASATSRVLPQSPIAERVEVGLYKLRGQPHTWKDVEDAKGRQETIDINPEVTYGTDGIIRYRITIGAWAQNGVISISASQQPLPDLGNGWNIVVDGNSYGKAKRDEYLLWGMGGAFNALAVQLGDRVELAFDAWEEPIIRVRKI